MRVYSFWINVKKEITVSKKKVTVKYRANS